MLSVTMLSVAMLSIAMLSVAMLSVAMLSVAMLSVAMLSVAMPSVALLSVAAPNNDTSLLCYKIYYVCEKFYDTGPGREKNDKKNFACTDIESQ
jgi:hypothetical protein